MLESEKDADEKEESVDNAKSDENEKRREDANETKESEDDVKSDEDGEREIDDLYNYYKSECTKYY